jgi:acylphosphatase
MPTSGIRVIVSGRVQGVGFRAFAAARARELGLRGHVRNVEDGTVESVAVGPAGAVEAYLAALRSGPPAARVSDLSVEDHAPEAVSETDFRVR